MEEDDDNRSSRKRAAYEAPGIEESGTFERLVLACMKIQNDFPPGVGYCDVMEEADLKS